MPQEWEKTLVAPSATVLEVMEVISAGNQQIALVTDAERHLLGTVTDGDIRRALLAKVDPATTAVTHVMNANPQTARTEDSNESMARVMRTHHIRRLPVLDTNGRIVALTHLDDLLAPVTQHDNWVVLMAGGLGQRLRPLTEDTPKPLLQVGSKPLLETIIETFQKHNFRKFYICVNYRGDMIKAHFGDGSRMGVQIEYIEEPTALGTAGALSLLPERPTAPVIVMNGDLLTRVNFELLLDFHLQEGASATMCVREYDFEVPFGVVHIEDDRIDSIDEKPVHKFFVNAGIYVLNPEVIDRIEDRVRLDMTTLFERMLRSENKLSAFLIREYWLDIGRGDDLDRAKAEFGSVFDE